MPGHLLFSNKDMVSHCQQLKVYLMTCFWLSHIYSILCGKGWVCQGINVLSKGEIKEVLQLPFLTWGISKSQTL